MIVLPLFRYILTAAKRDRFYLSLFGVLAVVASLSVFFGASSVTERGQFAITFMSFGVRLFGISCLVLFIVNYIRRAFEARDIDYLLSRPISRTGFILTHSLAFSVLALISALILGGIIVLLQIKLLQGGLFLWWGSLAAEFIIMANVAMFFAFVMKSATACTIIVFAFYLLTRLIGDILGILSTPAASKAMEYLEHVMEFISVFLPRLDLMGQSKWILYGLPENISVWFIAGQCIVFTALMIGATIVDFRRRQF